MLEHIIDGIIEDDKNRGLFRVKRTAFTSQEIFEQERKAIFEKTWLYAGHESELPGPNTFFTRKPGGFPVIITKDADGKINAFLNACPHRGNIVEREKSGQKRIFTCFYHAWAFDGKGKLVGMPGEDAYTCAVSKENVSLLPVRVENYRGLIFVTFDNNIVDLVTYLGGAKEYIDYMIDFGGDDVEIIPGVQKYCINANWKLLVENSIDGYHGFPTHARYFNDYLPAMGLDPSTWGEKLASGEWRGISLGNGHAVIEGPALPTPLDAKAPEELARIRAQLDEKFGKERAHKIADYNRNLLIYPNLILIAFWRTIRTFYPTAPGRVDVEAWAVLPRSDSEQLRQKRIENYLSFLGPAGMATPDDIAALEGCQRGFEALPDQTWSDISRGMGRNQPLATDELQMRAFWRRWYAMMRGECGEVDCNDHPEQARG